MSLYQLHKAMYTYLHGDAAERAALDSTALRDRFDLTDGETAAFQGADIAALVRLGVHPVLLNSYSRARLVPRDQYRAALRATTP